MGQILDYFEEFQPQFQYTQTANDGVWENALPLDQTAPKDANDSIAVEFFYKLNDGRKIFFGLRFSANLSRAPHPSTFIQIIKEVEPVSFEKLVQNLGLRLNNNPETFIAGVPAYLELGVEGHWKSVGSLVIDSENQEITNPLLLQNDKNHIALELAFTNPEHWIGVQVSDQTGGNFALNRNLLKNLFDVVDVAKI